MPELWPMHVKTKFWLFTFLDQKFKMNFTCDFVSNFISVFLFLNHSISLVKKRSHSVMVRASECNIISFRFVGSRFDPTSLSLSSQNVMFCFFRSDTV